MSTTSITEVEAEVIAQVPQADEYGLNLIKNKLDLLDARK